MITLGAMAKELTAKMLAYCHGVADQFSYADAYRAAYNVENMGPNSIASAIQDLMKNPAITRKIRELQAAAAASRSVTREWLVEFHALRASYDPAELTRTISGACEYCFGEGHGKHWRYPDYMEAMAKAEQAGKPLPDIAGGFGYNARVAPHPDCPKCDGKGIEQTWFADTYELSPAARAAFEGVKRTKDGLEIKMADKHAAAAALSKLCGFDVAEATNPMDRLPDPEAIANMTGTDASRAYQTLFGSKAKH